MLFTINKIKLFFLVLSMVLPFFTYSQSKVINSGWQFSKNRVQWKIINIPHTWNKTDAFDDIKGYRRGLGYYKKQVFIPAEEINNIHYLKFNAVNQEATVFINGKKIGNHKGGYTAFNFNISDYIKFGGYNLIEVVVDNSHNIDIPPLDADFTFYGGIYRNVELISLPKQHFSLKDFASDGFYVNYNNVSEKKANVGIKILIDNFEKVTSKNQVNLTILDAKGHLVLRENKKFSIANNSLKTLNITFPEIKNPNLWSPEKPYLYSLKIELEDNNGKIIDSKFTNIGFRWVSVNSEKGFFLNGKPIKLIGVNRHQDYKDYGNAVPLHLQKKDIELIKDMGANVIRFAHYPHARELYKLCDELGILVWTEIPIVNKVTDSPAFFKESTQMQKEHIKQYYNYPSVVMIGYMNEIFLRLAFDNKSSKPQKESLKKASLKLAKNLENLTRKLAPNHITVMACHLNEVYNETGIADIPMLLGWNLYFGWYDKEISDLGIFLDEQHKRYPKRSLLLSEYGPGADVRVFTKTPKKFDFSTNYQAKLHQSYYKQITDRPYMTGMTAWNFSDFGSEFRGDAIPHVNQKGLVQYDRTPKDIYYWYKSVLDKNNPFIHIASNLISGITLFEGETYPIQLYSNQDTASVFLNDEILQDVSFKNGLATILFPFKNEINHIKVVSSNLSKEKTIQVIKIDSIDFNRFKYLGINIGSHFYFNDQERGVTFVPDHTYQKNKFGYYNGTRLGITKDKNQGIPYNIKNSTSEPLFQTMLEGCTTYKVDIPKGSYFVELYFVEPQIKSTENIYNLSKSKQKTKKQQRIFDVNLNNVLIEKHFNIAKAYPEKYGVTLSAFTSIVDNDGLTITLTPVEGKPVISGILIKKLD